MNNHFNPREFERYKGMMKSHCIQLADLSEEEWNFLADNLILRKLKKGDFLSKEGETENYVSFICEGFIFGYLPFKKKQRRVYQFLYEGEFVSSYYSFLEQKPARVSLEALEDTTVLSFSYETAQLGYEHAKGMERLGRVCAEWLFKIKEDRELSFLTMNAEERYDEMLQKYPNVELHLTAKDIASYLNIAYTHLWRIRKNRQNGNNKPPENEEE